MATQLATTDTTAPRPIAKAPVAAGSALRAFVPNTLEEAWRLSTALAQSGMLPKAYGQDPNKVMVGMLAGAEVGLTPFVALQSIAVINGNPTMWGDGMLGLVEGSGLLEDFEETDDGKTATCRAVRKGRATPIIRTFSVDDAKTAGLSGKQGPWQQYPKRMRQLRARSFALRDGFSDILKGIKSTEEARDYAAIDGGEMRQVRAPLTAAGLIEAATAEPGVDPDTGEVMTGRSDEQHGDQFDGTDDPHPGTAKADEIVAAYQRATVIADALKADGELALHGDAMLDEDRERVEAAKAACDRRFGR